MLSIHDNPTQFDGLDKTVTVLYVAYEGRGVRPTEHMGLYLESCCEALETSIPEAVARRLDWTAALLFSAAESRASVEAAISHSVPTSELEGVVCRSLVGEFRDLGRETFRSIDQMYLQLVKVRYRTDHTHSHYFRNRERVELSAK